MKSMLTYILGGGGCLVHKLSTLLQTVLQRGGAEHEVHHATRTNNGEIRFHSCRFQHSKRYIAINRSSRSSWDTSACADMVVCDQQIASIIFPIQLGIRRNTNSHRWFWRKQQLHAGTNIQRRNLQTDGGSFIRMVVLRNAIVLNVIDGAVVV